MSKKKSGCINRECELIRLTSNYFQHTFSYEAWTRLVLCRSPTRLPTYVGAAFELFFIIFFHGFASTWLLFAPNRDDSARMLKQAEIGLKSHWNSRNRVWMRLKLLKFVIPQFYFEYLLLLLCFLFCCVSCLLLSLFCESRHSNMFLNNILIVKMHRKYK